MNIPEPSLLDEILTSSDDDDDDASLWYYIGLIFIAALLLRKRCRQDVFYLEALYLGSVIEDGDALFCPVPGMSGQFLNSSDVQHSRCTRSNCT